MNLGAVAFGWSEFMSLSDAPDFKEHNAKYGTYLDFFLASMKELETKHKKRLVHVLDVHWYPEARGTKRITEKDTSPKTVAARLQAPRSLWDATYTEKSWITGTWGKPIRLIPWLLERIAERYPGTKLAMTEYNFGARRPHLGRARAGRRARHLRTRGALPRQLLGRRPRQRHPARLHQVRLPPVPELRRQARHVRRHGGRGDAGRHREGVDLRGDRHEAEGPADDPGDQQGAAVDLQREDRRSRAASTRRRRSTRWTAAAPTSSRRRRST